MKKIMLGVTCAVMMAATPVLAAPSINGSTGLISSPTASTLGEGQLSLGYYNLGNGGTGSIITNIAPHLEVGIAGFRYDNTSNDSTTLNAKFSILPESIISPGFAIGIEDISNDQQRSSYAVISKGLPFGFKVHGGIGDGRYKNGFAGIETTINPLMITGNDMFPATTFIADYNGLYKKTDYGARVSIIPGLKVDIGLKARTTGNSFDHYYGLSFTNVLL